MAYFPRGITHSTELVKRLDALSPLPADLGIVNWRYTLDEDWSGDPAIYFWITLSDQAADRSVLGQTTRRIKDLIMKQIDPFGEWGLLPYFHFHSKSEQESLQDPVFG